MLHLQSQCTLVSVIPDTGQCWSAADCHYHNLFPVSVTLINQYGTPLGGTGTV
jgi:hypothetical protein